MPGRPAPRAWASWSSSRSGRLFKLSGKIAAKGVGAADDACTLAPQAASGCLPRAADLQESARQRRELAGVAGVRRGRRRRRQHALAAEPNRQHLSSSARPKPCADDAIRPPHQRRQGGSAGRRHGARCAPPDARAAEFEHPSETIRHRGLGRLAEPFAAIAVLKRMQRKKTDSVEGASGRVY